MSKNRISAKPDPKLPQPPATGVATQPTRITFIVIPRFNMTTLVTMIEPLRIANYLSGQPSYLWEIVSFDGPQVVASNQLTVTAGVPGERSRRDEHVFVLGSWGAEMHDDRRLQSWLRRQSRDGALVCPVEMGCYLVAKAGLLAGRRVTTHWSMAPGFAETYPDVDVVDLLYTFDNKFMSCSGGLAGVDLMLRLIASQHGEDMAGEVAEQMMHHDVRLENTPQRRSLGQGAERLLPIVRRAVDLIEQRVAEPMSVPEIARRLGVSQRQLERYFKQNVGCSAVQFSLLFRLQHARVLLISTRLSVREIAAASGFNTLSHFAYSFRKCFGRRPSDYRESWPSDEPAPNWPGTLSKFVASLHKRKTSREAAA